MTAYLEWREGWKDAIEWEAIGDPDDPRPCQHPPPLSPEDAFVYEFFRWNCRNKTNADFGMMPTLIQAIGMRRASLEVFMMKLDMIRQMEARLDDRKDEANGHV